VPVISIDGVVVAPEAATISVLDPGVLHGDGLFETLRTRDGEPVYLAEHLDRLRDGAGELGLHVPPELEAWLRAAIRDRTDHKIRIVVTRGGRTIIIVEPLPPQPRELSLAIVDWPIARRARPARKTLSFLDHLIARKLAADAGADEAVRLDADGHVAECATANIFAVIAGTVVTPPAAGILPGVTRARVLAHTHGVERVLTVPELRAADEIFVTSALRGVVPVTALDGVFRDAGPTFRSLVSLI